MSPYNSQPAIFILKKGGWGGGVAATVSLSHTPLDLFLNTLAPLLTTTTMSDANRQSLSDKMGAALKVRSTRLRGVGGRVLMRRESLTARL